MDHEMDEAVGCEGVEAGCQNSAGWGGWVVDNASARVAHDRRPREEENDRGSEMVDVCPRNRKVGVAEVVVVVDGSHCSGMAVGRGTDLVVHWNNGQASLDRVVAGGAVMPVGDLMAHRRHGGVVAVWHGEVNGTIVVESVWLPVFLVKVCPLVVDRGMVNGFGWSASTQETEIDAWEVSRDGAFCIAHEKLYVCV